MLFCTPIQWSQMVHGRPRGKSHEDDLDEMDLKWQLALLSMKARKFYQRTGKKIIINGSDTAGYDKKKLKKTTNVEESSSKAMLAIDGTGFDWSYMADEEASTNFALMAFSDSEIAIKRVIAYQRRTTWSFYKKNESMLCDQIVVLKRDASFNELDINGLKKQIAPIIEDWNFDEKKMLSTVALAIPGQTATGKESSNPFMAGSLPKTINSNNVDEESQKIGRQAQVMISDAKEYLISEDPVKQGRMEETENA
ncbi:hypothetical protein Tco_0144765 [Tanacetum coccineum]